MMIGTRIFAFLIALSLFAGTLGGIFGAIVMTRELAWLAHGHFGAIGYFGVVSIALAAPFALWFACSKEAVEP